MVCQNGACRNLIFSFHHIFFNFLLLIEILHRNYNKTRKYNSIIFFKYLFLKENFNTSLYSCKDINLLFFIFNNTILNFLNKSGLLFPAIIEPLNKKNRLLVCPHCSLVCLVCRTIRLHVAFCLWCIVGSSLVRLVYQHL